MKRLHVNLTVTELDASVSFYSALFAAQPTVLEDDYAKWMLDDPLVNFAISTHGSRQGVDHLGIQVESAAELGEVYERLQAAGGRVVEQGETTCCYARSEKNWTFDPQGIAWETFFTRGGSPVYGSDDPGLAAGESACCATPAPTGADAAACCAGEAAKAAPAIAGCCR